MKLEVELSDFTKQTCEDLSRSNPFVADDLLAMLNDACHLGAPDNVVLNKSQVALLVLLSDLGFKMVAAFQAHCLREQGIDPINSLINILRNVEEEIKKQEQEGGSPPLK